jgi:secreted PhoX family phosphatase
MTSNLHSSKFSEMLEVHLSRRSFVIKTAKYSAAAIALSGSQSFALSPDTSRTRSSLTFTEISRNSNDALTLPEGYSAQVLLSWGDSIHNHGQGFFLGGFKPAEQSKRFGYNCDYTAFIPLDGNHGLLCVNHEYANANLMFESFPNLSKDEAMLEMAAHGHSIVEIKLNGNQWQVVPESSYSRRFTGLDAVFDISGAAAGHKRLQTADDPSGTSVIGTYGNCAGGVTPWGTVLFCEENFDGYFAGKLPEAHPEYENHKRLGVAEETWCNWHEYFPRFDISKHPNEPNRFGWVIEYDPKNPSLKPVKRTSLGRFKHEAANVALSADEKVVVYSGDDEVFQCIYKFVSRDKLDSSVKNQNMNLLDNGTLYAARFNEDGSGEWLPLVYGKAPLDEANGFNSQADVLIDARKASALLGATQMDRPEDIEPQPGTNKVYAVFTNNRERAETDYANPRVMNFHGHIIEITVPMDKNHKPLHSSRKFRWSIFLLGGPTTGVDDSAAAGYFHPATSDNGKLSCPDNLAFDPTGRMWIASDGQSKVIGLNDCLYATETDGNAKALTRCFLSCPTGAEVTGPSFAGDGCTLFVSIQHPGEGEGASYHNPLSRYPSGNGPEKGRNLPPRPSVIAIRKNDGGKIGS